MANIINEKLKRRYFRRMKEASGYADSTICAMEKAIWLYEDFTQHEDFACFCQKRAVDFKRWLAERKRQGELLSTTTQYNYLRYLQNFFKWLSGQPGYKSKISLDNISYLSMDKKKVREAISRRQVKFPSLNYVRELAGSIKIKTEIDQRDQALIAFLLLSGMRDKAVATLPLGCFDRTTLRVRQDPQLGVQTKFGKLIHSVLIRFDETLVEYVVDWAEYLENQKLFADSDPLFPRSKVEHIDGGLTFVSHKVEPVYWKTTNSIRKMLEKRSAGASLEYYRPHSFRHTAINLATGRCHNGEEFRAVSQNFGHENIGTTLTTYGKLDDYRVEEVITNINFAPNKGQAARDQLIDDMMQQLGSLKNRDFEGN